MKRRIRWLILSASLALYGALLLLPHLAQGFQSEPSGATFSGSEKVEADLAGAMAGTPASAPVRYILLFEEKADLSTESLPQEEDARRRTIVSRLQERAALSQARARAELQRMTATGQVTRFEPLWIINGIAVRGTVASAAKMAGHPDVDRLLMDEAFSSFEPGDSAVEAAAGEGLLAGAWGVAQIGANAAWDVLGVRGDGVTVAIVDSGVALQHRDLFNNYRGNLGDGRLEHESNWYDTEGSNDAQPVDVHGHGTHVAGIAVGANGIGVAPGAQWIAVAIADEYGLIYDSNVHAAFQWLLAPGGDSDAAPDIANNSWGGKGDKTNFSSDVAILQAAGIVTVFAAGNSGPGRGTVTAPGSYADTIAVGASDPADKVAWFSGRGPSPLTEQTKPLLLAPGTQILSALPAGGYVRRSGTSMATPHVAGAIALMLEAEPGLTTTQVEEVLAQTAAPRGAAHPNSDSGWGRLDAYAAAASRLPHGRLQGSVSHDERPLVGVEVVVKGAGDTQLVTSSDADGNYALLLPPGLYDVQYSAFGFEALVLEDVKIVQGEVYEARAALQQRPMGLLSGRIRGENGQGVTAKISVEGTPKQVFAGADGRFSFWFPTGRYEVVIQARGRRAKRVEAQIKANQETALDVTLEDGPSILVIDSGPVQFDSSLPVYQEALIDAGYSSEVWRVEQPTTPFPPNDTLAGYDVVIWSAPSNSPGKLSASRVLTDYLGAGGNLLISGQDVARLDGQPGFEEPWFRHDLQARFSGEVDLTEQNRTIRGRSGTAFEGLVLRLNGSESAQVQVRPDEMVPVEGSLTRGVLTYAGGATAGLEAGYCAPHRIIQLGFGLEGIDGADTRRAVLEKSMDALLAPRTPTGVRWVPEGRQEITLPGETYVYDLTLQNMSETVTDTFALQIAPYEWATRLITPSVELGPCAVGQTRIEVDVPADAAPDKGQALQVTAVSRNNRQHKATFNLGQKTPGKLLLVDDDRFFDREEEYEEALKSLGYAYDVWDTSPGGRERGGPAPKFLKAYETVLWFTGYDWFAPVRPAENAALTEFLDGGGRLFLSSQDYLYYNWNTPLTRSYLGLLDYQETVTPTAVYANPALALPGNLAGPVRLNYEPYQNFSDGLVPQTGSIPFLWHEKGMAAGIANARAGAGRAIFWSLPLEALAAGERRTAMESILGWLSDLGDSEFAAERQRLAVGESARFTLTLRNLPQAPPVRVAVSNTLASGMVLVPGSLNPDVRVTPGAKTLSWQGELGPGDEKIIHYQATVASEASAGERLENKVTIANLDEGTFMQKRLALQVGGPDLSLSTLDAEISEGLPERWVSYTLGLRNSGVTAADQVTAVLSLPQALHVVTGTLNVSGGEAIFKENQVLWHGSLSGGATVTASVVLTQGVFSGAWLPAGAIIEDGWNDPVLLHDLHYSPPAQQFLPFVSVP